MTPPLRAFPIRRLAGAVLLAGALAVGSAAGAQDAATVFRFDPATHPAPPRLTIDRRPQVCARFLAKITAIYASETQRFDFPTAPDGPDEQSYGVADAWGFARVPWSDRPGEPGVERDFDGDGTTTEVLALIEKPHGMFEKSGLFLFPSREEMLAARDLDPFDATLANGWTTPVLLENDGAFVVFYPWNYQFDLGTVPLQLLALSSGGSMEPACEVEIFPKQEGSPPQVPLPGDASGEGLRRQMAAVTQSIGMPTTCGTSRLNGSNDTYTLLYRPWVPFPHDGIEGEFPELEALAHLRDDWRYQDLWNFRIYREIETAMEPARKDLAQLYAKHFGVGNLSIEFTRNRILQMIEGAYSTYYYRRERDVLAAALLSGEALDHIDGDSIVIGERRFDVDDYGQRLVLALEHPKLVAFLLEHGADVNVANGFGKTPLMYAAHFGLTESARLLLEHGADPNRRTTQKPSLLCNTPFKWTGRTALMYAAENASAELIELLIENGADIAARDVNAGTLAKPDRGIADYLRRNVGLNAAQRQALIERWSIPTTFAD